VDTQTAHAVGNNASLYLEQRNLSAVSNDCSQMFRFGARNRIR